MKKVLMLFGFAALLMGPSVGLGADGWSDDYDAVQAAAKKSGKVVVIDFTGSDW